MFYATAFRYAVAFFETCTVICESKVSAEDLDSVEDVP